MRAKYSIGLDYGTNSVRALIVDTTNGREVGTAVWEYAHGTHGVILSRDPNLARQHPADYLTGAEITIQKALAQARRTVSGFKPDHVVGLGVDTTGSTPMPVDARRQGIGIRQTICPKPRRYGLVVERPHRCARSRGDHPSRAGDAPAIPGEMRWHILQRMVLQQDPPLPAYIAGRVRRGVHVGRNRRLDSGHADGDGSARQAGGRGSARPATRPCTTTRGAVIPMPSFSVR